jgi:hypothetical protein
MNHSFNVEIAKKYGIEKAVLLENFYFWVKKNQANKKNIHNGKAYTVNTAEAFAELFPYIKERKIAQLLREMENQDGLLLSGQFHKYDRTKSYTLTDFALSLYEPNIQNSVRSNIQKLDNGKSENGTIKDTEKRDCIYTDINTDINADINISAQPKSEKSSDLSPYDFLITQYLVLYAELYRDGSVKTEKPCYNEKQIRKQINELLKSYTVYELYAVLTNAKNDKWLISTGFSISLVFAASQVQRLLNSTAPQYPQERQKKKIYTDADYLAGASDLDNTPF